jgi:molybdopterin molybdotransferase
MIQLPWQELAARLAARINPVTGMQHVALQQAAGRRLARDALAARAIPAFDHAVMDGFAIGGAAPGNYRIADVPVEMLDADQAVPVAAGQRVPLQTACVVLIHNALIAQGMLKVSSRPRRDNIRRAAEEAKTGETVLKSGIRLDARHVALAAAAGVTELEVVRQPRIALLGLHNQPEALAQFPIMAAMLTTPSLTLSCAGVVRSHGLQRQLALLAANHDMVVVVADSLRGEDSLLVETLLAAGGKADVWRANLKPAKPIISGTLGNAQILGLAGTAYATVAAAHLFLQPMVQCLLGLENVDGTLPAQAAFVRTREPGRAEALPVFATNLDGVWRLSSAGRFGQLRALAAMDGMALIDGEQADIVPGTALRYLPIQIPLV